MYGESKHDLELHQAFPENEKFSKNKLLVDKLRAEQRIYLGPTLSFVATLLLLVVLNKLEEFTPAILFVLPGLLVGLLIKYFAKPFEEKHKVIASIACSAAVFLFFLLQGINLSTTLLPILNFGVCYALSKRTLKPEEEEVISQFKLEKVLQK